MPGISVRCEGLRVTRGDKTILNDVSVAFPEGDFVAVMGASGAGKTTFLNTLMGRPGMGATFSGKVLFDTLDMNAASIEERDALRKRTGYVTQDDIMFNTLTPREQIKFRLLNVGVDCTFLLCVSLWLLSNSIWFCSIGDRSSDVRKIQRRGTIEESSSESEIQCHSNSCHCRRACRFGSYPPGPNEMRRHGCGKSVLCRDRR